MRKNRLAMFLMTIASSSQAGEVAPIATDRETLALEALYQQTMQEVGRLEQLSNALEAVGLERFDAWVREQRSVPAMWVLADAYHAAGDHDTAAEWVYTAFLGTRMDAALCRQERAMEAEYPLVRRFNAAVQEARRDLVRMGQAIAIAVEFHSSSPEASLHSGWACQWAGRVDPVERSRIKGDPLLSGAKAKKARMDALSDFRQAAMLPEERNGDDIGRREAITSLARRQGWEPGAGWPPRTDGDPTGNKDEG